MGNKDNLSEKPSITVATPNMGSPTIRTETVWDRRPVKYHNILISVCSFIFVMELAERLSYYGINQGLKNFMNKKLGWSQVASNSLKSTWTSLCYLTPLMGAWIADEKWGRYKTIMVFGIWYVVGDFLVAIAAYPDMLNNNKDLANAIFNIGLFAGIGVGTGAIKSNVVTFGADQFDPHSEDEVRQREEFFSWFYWCINIGASFSYGYLSYLCVEGSGAISVENGYFATFLICAFVMVFAIVIFTTGHWLNRYVLIPPSESALSKVCRVIYHNCGLSIGAKSIVLGFVFFLIAFVLNVAAAFIADSNEDASNGLTYFSVALMIISMFCWIAFGMNPTYMDVSKQSNGGSILDLTVDEVKAVIRCLPFAAFMVMWHTVYDQIDANFQSITQQCDLRISGDDQIPAPTLGVFGPISIIIIIPVLEKIIYPLYTRISGHKPSSFGKVFAGLTIATVAMVWSALLEVARRDSGTIINLEIDGCNSNCLLLDSACYNDERTLQEDCVDFNLNQICKDECFNVDNGAGQPMNYYKWYNVIPLYLLVGAAECLINVTAFDVFYTNVPEYLKSTCQAINLFMTAMGANMTSIFTLIFGKYIHNNMNAGNIEYMYYALTVASVLNLALFTFVMWKMQFSVRTSKPYGATEEMFEDDKLLEARASENSMDSRQSIVKQM